MFNPFKPVDYKKLFKKAMIFFTASIGVLMIGFVLIYIVFRPIIWVTNMLGKIGDMLDFNSKDAEVIRDYREDLDEMAETNKIAFKYSEMLACSMNSKFTHDVKGCFDHLTEDGTFDPSIDTEPAGSFQLYSKDIQEYQGTIPDSAYEDIWMPTLYEKDHYKEQQKTDPDTGQPMEDENGNPVMEWVFDYTENTVYKDACDALAPETECRKTRDGFYTYPYIPPAGGEITQRYGYDLLDENSDVGLKFHKGISYGAGYVLAISTGEVVETNQSESYVIQKISNNGTEFYAKYTGLSSIACTENIEYEQNEILGIAGNVSVETYFLINNQQHFFNPMLLFSTAKPWKYGDLYAVTASESGEMLTGGIMEIEGVKIDFGSKYYVFNADGITGNPCVCDFNNTVAWPYNRCVSASITGSFNKMICSSYAAGRYWEVNNPEGNFPLPRNWDQKLSIDRVSPGSGTYSTDPNHPIAKSICSIRFGSVMHDVFIEGVSEDGSVLISECNATSANQYGFRVRKFNSLQAFLSSYGANLIGMYGP